MFTIKFPPFIPIFISLSLNGFVHAAEMKIDCKLKGGSVVQLTAEACKLEGGAPASEAAAPAPETAPADTGAAAPPPPANSPLAESQKAIVDLLGKTVEYTTPMNRNPEGIERTAKFEGCRLVVDENLHIQYGNFYSVWKDFKVHSAIDFQKINRNEFGILGEIASKGGDLKGTAVYIEEPRNKNGNNISISVLNLKDGNYTKYATHGPSAYWSTPRSDLWIADEYGYVRDSGSKQADFGIGNAVTDKIRILLIVKSADDAEKLKNAFDETNRLCSSQPTEPNSK